MSITEKKWPWIIDINYKFDKRAGIKVRHIESGNDGDICNSCVTYEILTKHSSVNMKNMQCIDIGVDEGWWSFFVADIDPNFKIQSFEPNPVSYKALQPYLEGPVKSQIELHNIAISDSYGTLPFIIEGGQSNSRVAKSEENVACERIDQYIGNKHIDLLKIDTEGHDLKILATLHPYIENGQIGAIIFECTPYWYGNSKGECISKTVEELLFLKSKYTYMYLMSRRGDPELESLKSESDIFEFAIFSYDEEYQVDIVVTNSPIKTIPIDV